jgi:hypothetical protein
MTEHSMLWTTGSIGDGANGYDMTETTRMFAAYFGEGVVTGYLNTLAVTGIASPISINTGGAILHGFFYHNDTALPIVVATPITGTTGFRVVIRADWDGEPAELVIPPLHPATSKWEARIVVLRSADGTAAIPAAQQDVNDIWDLTLATGTITVAGVITLTDARTYFDLVRLAALASYLTTAAHTAIGNGAPHHAPTTLGVGSDAALALAGQELTLTLPAVHAAVTLGGGSDPALALAGQQLTLTLPASHAAVTLNANSGMKISGQEVAMDTPSTLTAATTNAVTTNTHTHEVTGFAVPGDLHLAQMVDTKANILASTATSGKVGFATDTRQLFLADGTNWNNVPLTLALSKGATTDIGGVMGRYEETYGYGLADISNKTIHNAVIGGFVNTAVEGAVRYAATTPALSILEVYNNAAWRTVIMWTVAQLDDRVQWTDFTTNDKDAFGNDYIHGHRKDIGAFASEHLITGGSF